jgi:hypothetical protein
MNKKSLCNSEITFAQKQNIRIIYQINILQLYYNICCNKKIIIDLK